jgi:hypothetical protein
MERENFLNPHGSGIGTHDLQIRSEPYAVIKLYFDFGK